MTRLSFRLVNHSSISPKQPASDRRVLSLLAALLPLLLSFSIPLSAQRPDESSGEKFSHETFEREFEHNAKGDFQRNRADWFYHQRAYPHKRVPPGARLRALRQLEAKLAREAAAKALRTNTEQAGSVDLSSSTWTQLGPQPANSFGLTSSGRITALAVDPTNALVVFAGAADGGIWKTTDGGTTWTALTDTQVSLATGAIAIDPENHNTLYVGTGELNNAVDSYYGAGILKSTDGGTTWANYPGPFAGGGGGGARIGGLAVHPTNSAIVLAAVGCCGTNNSGVYRSTDGGQTWTNVLNNGNQAYNVYFDVANPNNAYASTDSTGIFKSTDAGVTWTAQNGTGANVLPTGSGIERFALAIDPNNTQTLFAGVTNTPFGGTGGLIGLYKSTDGGSNWTQLTSTPDYCGSQCWYDNVIAVAPGNSNAVFAGGAGFGNQMYQSLDGGNTWNLIGPGNNSTIHPDLHALVFSANGATLYIGNDGGVYSTTQISVPITTVATLNSQLATLQFYPGPVIHPTNVNIGYSGTQDNGTLQYSGAVQWNGIGPCGDGARNLIDLSTPSTIYVTCTQLAIFKSTDGGVTFNQMQNGIDTSGTDSVAWVPPFSIDPSATQNLYFGSQFVYQTKNGASSWSPISPDLTGGNGNNLSAIAVAPTSSNTIYTGSSDAHFYVTQNALSGSPTWTSIDNATSLPNRFPTAIAVDPISSSTAYFAFSGFSGFGDNLGHVFKTTNSGSSYADISGDLPNVPVDDILVDPVLSNTIYIATDVGVFYTTNGGSSWATLVSGLPRVTVQGLAYQKSTHTLWAATHGRSMWGLNVTTVPAVPAATTLSPASVTAGAAQFSLIVTGSAFISGAVVQWNGANLATTFNSSTQLTATVPANNVLNGGTAIVEVLSGGLASNSLTFTINNPLPAATSLTPASATAGGTSFTLTVNGSSFVNGASVLWKGSSRTTTFVNSTQLTATINSSDITTAGLVNVTVLNPAPGGGTSNALTFTINNPVPALTSIAPTSKTEGSVSFTLTVNGSSFVNGATVNWNGSPRTTTFKTSTKLTAAITAADIATAGTFPVTATNPAPGGGISGAITFTVNNPKPKITSLAPSSATAGGVAFILTVNGSNFVHTSVVNWAGSPRTTSFVSATRLTATINAADIATAGTFHVTVANPAPGGGTSGSSNFTVNNPVPSLTLISPNAATAGGAAFTLTATGTKFVSTSKVQWNGVNLATTFVNSTSLTATVPTGDIKTSGTASVTVNTGTPGGGISAAKTFTINNPAPSITSLTPTSATHGGAAFTLTVIGTNFVAASTVNWKGSPRTTTFLSSTRLTATINAADIATAGSATVTVTNPTPGGGTSTGATFTIN